jgi:hypothetical protein
MIELAQAACFAAAAAAAASALLLSSPYRRCAVLRRGWNPVSAVPSPPRTLQVLVPASFAPSHPAHPAPNSSCVPLGGLLHYRAVDMGCCVEGV